MGARSLGSGHEMPPAYDAGFGTLTEELDRELPVEGEVPSWLSGALIRNGPALFAAGGDRVDHWFDGLAMLRKFAVDDGRVRYRNRFLRTEAFADAMAGRLGGGFGTGTDGSLVSWLRSLRSGATDNTNVNVARLGGEFVALTETTALTRFDPETLATRGRTDYGVDGQLTTAHPHHDDARGETLNLVTKFGRENEYRVTRQPDGTWEREVLARIPVERPGYIHSFAVTPNHVVVAEFPLVVTPWRLLLPSEASFIERYDWDPDRGTRFLVVDRDVGAVVAEHRTGPVFAFHHVNAFERDGRLVLDLVAFEDASAVEALYLDELAAEDLSWNGGALERFRLSGTGVERETLYEGGIGLPRCSPAVHRRRHRYVYGQGTAGQPVTDFPHELVKVDCRRRTVRRWGVDGWYFSEPVFVPRPGGDREDEGVVLAVALDHEADRSVFVVLDGESFEERARAPLPHALPFDFHGQFFPGLD